PECKADGADDFVDRDVTASVVVGTGSWAEVARQEDANLHDRDDLVDGDLTVTVAIACARRFCGTSRYHKQNENECARDDSHARLWGHGRDLVNSRAHC